MRHLFWLVLSACTSLWFHTPKMIFAQSANQTKPIKQVINVSGGTMQYDTRFFVVMPGNQVTVVLTNSDLMPHNLVICDRAKEGEDIGSQVQQAAWRMGDEGMAKHYIPDDKRVLFATKMAQPGKNETLSFKAPTAEGDYPFVCTFPGHVTMRGIMRVANDLNQKPPKMDTPNQKQQPGKNIESRLPYAYRTNIAGISPQTICVGSPQKLHYAFNPETCTLAKVWIGNFLNVKKDQGGRGGGGSKINGKIVFEGEKKFPLTFNGKTPTKMIYRGYRLSDEGYPTFMYTVDGLMVHHHIAPDKEGKRLSQQFHLKPSHPTAVIYHATRPEITDSQTGKFQGGQLSVKSNTHIHMEVGIKP